MDGSWQSWTSGTSPRGSTGGCQDQHLLVVCWLPSCEMSLEHFSLRPSWAVLEHLAPFGRSAWEAKEGWPGEYPAPWSRSWAGQDGGAGHLPGMQPHPSRWHQPLDLCQRYVHEWGRDVVPGEACCWDVTFQIPTPNGHISCTKARQGPSTPSSPRPAPLHHPWVRGRHRETLHQDIEPCAHGQQL